jgi:PAS domain S-box-containing protein
MVPLGIESFKTMNPSGRGTVDFSNLRKQAEELLRAVSGSGSDHTGIFSSNKIREIFHELSIHQIELEMQNEELRRTQGELEASRSRYFDLYDLAPVGYVTLSEQGVILEANLTAADLLGVPRKALVRQPATRFILPEDQDLFYRHRRRLFETVGPQKWELRMIKPDGGPFWVMIEAVAVRDEEKGRVCRVTISDRTEHKKIEKLLRQTQEMKLLGQVAAGMAHEVRNPLQAILSLTDALSLDGDQKAESKLYLDQIRVQVNRLSALMRDLLELGRAADPAYFQKGMMGEILSATFDLWQETPWAKSHRLSLFISREVETRTLNSDLLRLRQILFNLLENAAQNSPVGREIQFHILEQDPKWVKIQIVDQGVGIPEAQLKRVFDPFFTTRQAGSGLGLTLVKSFVQSLGGQVDIRNNDPPPGCTVEVLLPMAGKE